MSTRELKQKQKKVAREILDLESQLDGGSKTDLKRFDDLTADLDGIEARIRAQEALDSGEARKVTGGFGQPDEDRESRPSFEPETGGSYFEKRRAEGWSEDWHADIEHFGLGDFLAAAAGRPTDRILKRALAEGTDTAGGFLVPEPLKAKVIDRLWEALILKRVGARFRPMESEVEYIGRIANEPSVNWTAENASITSTDMNFDRVTLMPKKLAGLSQASREFVMDAFDAPTVIENAYLASMGHRIESAALVGSTASGGPSGVYESTATTNTSVAGSTVDRISWTDVADGWEALAAANVPTDRLSAVMSPRTFKHLGIEQSTGSGGWKGRPELLNTLRLYPTATITNDVAVGATTDSSWLTLGDFRAMTIGIRLDPQIEVLKERYADSFQYGFLGAARIGVALSHGESFLNLTNLST